MSLFKELLSIKAYRENRALAAVGLQRAHLAQARLQRDQALQELQDFRSWASRRERELFSDLCARTVRLREIQDVHSSVSDMRLQAQRRAQDHEAAEEGVRREAAILEDCRRAHAEAWRIREKFLDLVRSNAEEAARELECGEDLESEEAALQRRDSPEWGSACPTEDE